MLAFSRITQDTTVYLYVSKSIPTDVRPIGMEFSLYGQFASALVLLQTAPIAISSKG